ncbi:MAG: PAS domain S-box protein [Spirochaetota bacterium]
MLITLINNVTLLIALSVVWGQILLLRKQYPNAYRVISGVLFGISAIFAMLIPLTFEEGIIYDGRSVVIALSGLFGGGISTLIASLIAGAYRMFLGGSGVYAGVASIIVSAATGLLVRRIHNNNPVNVSFKTLVLFAVFTHLLVLLCQLLLPWPKGLIVIKTIGVSYLLLLSSGLVIISLFLKSIEQQTLVLQNLKADVDELHDILSINPSVLFSIDPASYTVRWVSPNIQVVLGCELEELLQKRLLYRKVIHDDEKNIDILFDTIQYSNFASTECRVVTESGIIKWIDIHLRAIKDEHNTITELFGSMTDITERKKIAKRLEESEEQYRSIFEDSKAVMLIIDPDDGRIVNANTAAEQFYGWHKDELLSMKISDINTLSTEELHQKMDDVKNQKRVFFECKHRAKDGSVRDVEVYSSAVLIGGKTYLFSIIHDITAKKKAENALIKSEELFRLIFDNAPMGIYSFDEKGMITACNDNFVAIIGSSHEALIGLEILKLPNKKVVEAVMNCLNGMQSEYKDWYTSDTGNKTTPVRALFSPLIVEGRVIGGLAIVEDLTVQIEAEKQKEKLEEQLRQAQKLESIGRLVGGIAHDFNNILSMIAGYTELIKIKIAKDSSIYSDLEEIVNATKRSADIVRQLLTFSRQQKIHPTRINLNKIINTNQRMLKTMIGENVTMQLNLSDDVCDIWIDEAMFVQILTNLASNSRDAIRDIGTITITTQNKYLDEEFAATHLGCNPGEYVMLQFSDTGTGMDKETLEKIFEPFFTTKDVGKGTGLGLSTVYGIVKQFNGYITVYSEIGKGTVVNIFFPRYVEQVPELPQERAVKEVQKIPKKTIVLVEDDVSILDMLTKMLTLLEQEVIAYNDPVQALNDSNRYKDTVAILITDIIMPIMNGRELYEAMKQICPNLKVIFISGYANDVFKEVGIDTEHSSFLQKPFTIDDLQKALKNISNTE